MHTFSLIFCPMKDISFHNPFKKETVLVKIYPETEKARVEEKILDFEIDLNGLGFIVSSLLGIATVALTLFFILKSSVLQFIAGFPDIKIDFDALSMGISFPFLTVFFSLATLRKSYLAGNPNILKIIPVIVSTGIRIQNCTTWVYCEIIFVFGLFFFYFGDDERSHASRQILKPWIKREIGSKYARTII